MRDLHLAVLVFSITLVACRESPNGSLRNVAVTDPITGQRTDVEVANVGEVEVVTPADGSGSFAIIYLKGQPISETYVLSDRQHTSILDRQNASLVTLESEARSGNPLSITYGSAGWVAIDENFDGQIDTRGKGQPLVTEIWVDGGWRIRRVDGSGKDRHYLVGDREVLLTPDGWEYAPGT